MSKSGITLTVRLKALMEAATESLTGEKVEITFRQPVPKSAQGHVYKTTDGRLMIDIRSNLPDEEFLFTLIHEIGHIFNEDVDLPEFSPCDYFAYPSGFLPENTKEEIAEHLEKNIEKLADLFAEQIGDYARREALYLFGNDEIETRLRVLSMTQILRPEEKPNE